MSKLQLFGGEKDGWSDNVSPDSRPDVFYAVPNLDDDLIKKAHGTKVKEDLREKLSVLAYKFDADKSTANHFRMMRCPELDRVRQT